MDCCICSPMVSVYRLPRNAICAPCHEGAKAIIGFLNKSSSKKRVAMAVLKSRGSMMKPDSATKVGGVPPDAISLPELTHDELALLLAFLYTGTLLDENGGGGLGLPVPVEERANKYDVPFLLRACEARLAAAVDISNALRTLEVAELSSSAALRERAMDMVVEHAERVVFSPEYDDFAIRNAGLCVEITRALLMAKMNKNVDRRR